MKVNGPGAGAPTNAAGGARRAGGPGFAPATGATGAELASYSVAGAGGIASVAALLALQETPPPLERRRRAVARAGKLLDVLDEVKLALLGGEGSGVALDRLKGAVVEARDATDDPRLEGILDQIETRAAVELAKREAAGGAA
jgi:hypothetical protein